jgi:transposase InsO family protein
MVKATVLKNTHSHHIPDKETYSVGPPGFASPASTSPTTGPTTGLERACSRINRADFTYVWTAEGWLYVAAVIDLFSRRVVGWSMSAAMTAQGSSKQ